MNKPKSYRSFEQCRDFARSLNLKSLDEWNKYSKSKYKPKDIPACPQSVFAREFKGIQDWLGFKKESVFLPFEEARNYARSLGLKSYKEWNEFATSDKKPDNIPAVPKCVYANKFRSIYDWLGHEKPANKKELMNV